MKTIIALLIFVSFTVGAGQIQFNQIWLYESSRYLSEESDRRMKGATVIAGGSILFDIYDCVTKKRVFNKPSFYEEDPKIVRRLEIAIAYIGLGLRDGFVKPEEAITMYKNIWIDELGENAKRKKIYLCQSNVRT